MEGRHVISPGFLKLGFCVVACLVAGLALYPNLQLPEPRLTAGFTDKIYHVVGCTILVLLAATAWRIKFQWLLLALPLSIVIEFIQGFSPGRGVHLLDMIANLAGVLVALTLLFVFGRLRSIETKC